jgi:PiT family inorganic phosphate transporter
MFVVILFLATFFLAYNNGANDNFKGVATLYGSGILSYKKAIIIATIATMLGSIYAIFLANGLVESFSGKGLVSGDVAGTMSFLIAVGFGAGSTVLLATILGFPISTTHAIIGSLIGAGLMSVGLNMNFYNLGSTFLVPLLISPFIAFVLGMIVYLFFTKLRKRLHIDKESCFCIGKQKRAIPVRLLTKRQAINLASDLSITGASNLHVELASHATCQKLYTNKVLGFSMQKLLDSAHIMSGAAVSFARGLNDTPKIAGLLVAIKVLNIDFGMIAIALGMAIGGLLNSKKVAVTMSKKITTLNPGQGFSANLVTSFLVIVASKFGVPVSTTHVSVGSLFGIGLVSHNHNASVIKNILWSWVITLPVSMFFSAVFYELLQAF